MRLFHPLEGFATINLGIEVRQGRGGPLLESGDPVERLFVVQGKAGNVMIAALFRCKSQPGRYVEYAQGQSIEFVAIVGTEGHGPGPFLNQDGCRCVGQLRHVARVGARPAVFQDILRPKFCPKYY